MIVPVYNNRFVGCINTVVIGIFCNIGQGRAELAFKRRIALQKQVVVAQLYMKQVGGSLYIGDTRFPKQI